MKLDDVLPKASLRVYEVFRQEAEGEPLVHAGQIEAPDDDLAMQYAREGYGRRNESVRLWVIERSNIIEINDRDFLHSQFDKSYKSGKGYRIAVEKRRNLREKLGTTNHSALIPTDSNDEDGA